MEIVAVKGGRARCCKLELIYFSQPALKEYSSEKT